MKAVLCEAVLTLMNLSCFKFRATLGCQLATLGRSWLLERGPMVSVLEADQMPNPGLNNDSFLRLIGLSSLTVV